MSFVINPYAFEDDGIPTGNLLAYLRFNNNVNDEVGNFSPTSTGVTYTNGLYSGAANEAAVFNSVDKVRISDDNLLSFGDGSDDNAFSLSFAVNVNSFSTLNYIFTKRSLTSTTADREYAIFFNTSGLLTFQLFDESAGAFIFTRASASPGTSTTKHYIVTYDGSSSTGGFNIYVDGVLDGSATTGSSGTYTAMENLTAPVEIGAFTAATSYYDGKLDGLGLWDKELTSDEVTAIYNKQSSGTEIL